MINMEQVERVYEATQIMKAKARETILAHDANAIDILEMLGLGEVE